MVWTPINHGDTDLPNCLDCICMKSFTQRFQFFLAFFDTFEATRRHWMELPGASVFFSIRIFFLRRPKLWMLQTTRRWGSTADFGDVELRCGFGDGMATLKTQRLSCLHFTQSSTLLFDFELIQVPNFQKLSWNRIYPEAPPPKKLTAFGNLEDVKPPCQLLGIPATARPTCSSVLNQLLSQSWGRCCRCDGLMMGDGRKDGGGD